MQPESTRSSGGKSFVRIPIFLFSKADLNLKEHTKNAHEGKNDFKCSKCNWMSTNFDSLIEHNKIFHKDTKCDVCGKAFSENNVLRKHIDRKHVNIINEKYNCQSCKKLFINNQALRQHIKKHHIGKDGDRICD